MRKPLNHTEPLRIETNFNQTNARQFRGTEFF